MTGWDNFYVIVGSSAAALIGLQFVAMALIADKNNNPTGSQSAIRAFGTPTVVHLGAALVVSAVVSAPWPTELPIAIILASCGVAGTWVSITVIYHARRQSTYRPVFEDWLWHVILPSISYLLLAAGGLLLVGARDWPPFIIAAGVLGTVLIAVHNAWDTVTYIVTELPAKQQDPGTGKD